MISLIFFIFKIKNIMYFPKIKTLNTLIIINVISFFVILIINNFINMASTPNPSGYSIIGEILYLKMNFVKNLITPWSLITYSFMHSSFMHLFGNMLMFFFTGIMFVQEFGERKLLSFYLTSAVFVGITIMFFNLLFPSSSIYALGASGVVFGVLTAIGYKRPNMEVNLFFILPVKLKWLVIALLVLQISMLSYSSLGHLSGALFGFLFVYYLNKGVDITSFTDKIINYFYRYNKPIKYTYKNNPVKKSKSKRNNFDVDEILDKINRKGMFSLTMEEIKFLKNR